MATRFRLKCERLQELIREQSRLDLIGIEPTSQERDDITSLLTAIRPAVSTDGNLRRQYKSYLAQLRDLDFDTEPYELSEAVDGLGPLDPALDGELPAKAESNQDQEESQTQPRIALSPKKSVRFSDESPELRYRDDLEAPDSHDVYDTNQEMLLDQDRRLYTLGDSVERQRQLGLDVNGELRTHIDLLDDLEMQTDRSQLRLNTASDRVKIVNRKMREHGFCLVISCLVLILFILLIVF